MRNTRIEDLTTDLIVLMKSKNPLISVVTFEELRAAALIEEIAGDPRINRNVWYWSCTRGLIESGKPEPVPGSADPLSALMEIEQYKTNGKGAIFILYDFHNVIKEDEKDQDPVLVRKLRDLSISLKSSKKSIVFISPFFKIPRDLTKAISIYDLPFPSKVEIEARIKKVLSGITDQITALRDAIEDNKGRDDSSQVIVPGSAQILTLGQIKLALPDLVNLERFLCGQWKENKTALIDACLGLTDEEIENLISQSVVRRDLNISTILNAKKMIIRKDGGIEYFETDQDLTAIGGMDRLKNYALRAAKMWSKEAQEYGCIPHRGILLIGAPGTGKSLFAKAISRVMKKPLLKLNLSALRTKWYGESGQNLIRALKSAHAIAPAILWMDEIDKAISSSGGQGMHEESAGMFGTLLTDMEENPGLFFLATCNSPFNLPPELMSRFQKVFYVDLPSKKERIDIFSIQIKAIGRDPSKIDLISLSDASPGYSGREIRNIVQESLSIAFDTGAEFSTGIILDQIKRIVPISVQKKDEIDRMKAWSAHNAENASEPEIAPESPAAGTGRRLEVI